MRVNFVNYSLLVSAFLIISISLQAQNGEKPQLTMGGAFRFNCRYNDWNEANRKQRGSMQYDMFRINADAIYKKIQAHAEYRFYSKSNGGGMLKSGWIGYNFDEKNQLRFGQTTVPFGILPYQSNSYFFNINYYIGLEDDDDMGISYQHSSKQWQMNIAFFKNSDLLNSEASEISASRYSYDIGGRSKEINTVVGRVAYKGGKGLKYEFGASGFLGQTYNIDSKKNDGRYAYAAHAILDWNRWNLKTQFTLYDYSNEESRKTNSVTMVAFDAPYKVADKGKTYSACLSYTIHFKNKFVESIKIYNDYSYLNKSNHKFNDSQQNVFGCSVSAGPILVYADIVTAKNQSWINPEWDNSFADGANDKWHTRLNLNVGYYF
jgi:hypothetical protein